MFDELLRNSAVQAAIQVIVTFQMWLYALLALGGLLALRAVLRARRERSRALFGLEREAAANRMSSALWTLFLLLGLGLGVWGLANYATPEAIAQRVEARRLVGVTATAMARATLSSGDATRIAMTPSPTPPRPTATRAPTTTPTPAPPDITQTCHGEGEPAGKRFIDRQAVNLRRTPDTNRTDNIERTLLLNTELCVYGEEQKGDQTWLKVTVAEVEGFTYVLKQFTRE